VRLRPPRTLRGRAALAATVTVAVVLVVLAVALVAGVAASERAALDRDLRARAARLLGPARMAVRRPRVPPRLQRSAAPFAAAEATLVQVYDGEGIVFDNAAGPAGFPAPRREGVRTVEVAGESWRAISLDLGPPGARLQVATSLAPSEARAARMRRDALLAVLLGAVACALAVRGLTRLALRPLGDLQAGAARVSTTRDLTARLPDDAGPEEVDDVARSLNAMLARLAGSAERTEAALEAARRFTADAGHELRTPLQSLRANLDTLARNPDLPAAEREAVLAEARAGEARLASLLEALQALARGDAGAGDRTEEVDLADVADAAVLDARRRHPGVSFAIAADGATLVRGAAEGLRAIADNLLENAARHGARSAEARVVRAGDRVVLAVDDDGPGIPEAEREHVFGRFARGRRPHPPRATGSGLGLAIVAQQAGLHGGEARAEASPRGGARVVVDLPAAPQAIAGASGSRASAASISASENSGSSSRPAR
jgi:signal transduction histidine kinase